MANSVAAGARPAAAVWSLPDQFERQPWFLALGACVLVLVFKMLLIGRLNISWDEFFFLSMVHAFVRGELNDGFQTAYTHLFSWLPSIAGDEAFEILVARALMVVLLAVTVALIAKLAARWVSRSAVWIAPLSFLVSSPVLKHGGSFRADSLLAPLTLGVLLLVTGPASRRNAVIAGVLLGVAMAITAKAALMLPLVLALEVARAFQASSDRMRELRASVKTLLVLGVVAAAVGATILLAHRLTLPPVVEGGASFAKRTLHSTILDVPFMPRLDYLRVSLHFDRATWILLAIGVVAAAARRNWSVLACALGLFPLLFYRNAFPYYYVVMLAPACVLAAFGVDEMRRLAGGKAIGRGRWVPLAACALLILQAAVLLSQLTEDQQENQRTMVAAVHRVFPKPVAYIDHSGMIASFHKVNFFMSSWGVTRYRDRGESFMPGALARYRPALLLANREVLDPDERQFNNLLPEDQKLLSQFYVPYWGPIRVAGAQSMVQPAEVVKLAVPFPGRYRVLSGTGVSIDGVERKIGEAFEIAGTSCEVRLTDPSAKARVRIIWAEAAPPPAEAPPDWLYTSL